MRVSISGALTSEPFTDIYRNTLIIYSPASVTTGKAQLQYTLDNSRLLSQGSASWTAFATLTLSATVTFVMPEYGAVRIVNYADVGTIEIKEVIPSLGTSVLPDQVGNSGKILTTDGKISSWQAAAGVSTLPSQTGNAAKVLTTDGSTASWDYGPIGGWVTPTTNTRAALQVAIDYALAHPLTGIYMPPGTTYTFDDTQLSLNITNNTTYGNISLCFYSPGRVYWDTSAFTTPKAALLWRGYNGGSGWHVIEGVNFVGSTTNSYGLEFQNCVGVRIRRCSFQTLAIGIKLYNVSLGDFTEDIVAEECRFTRPCGTILKYSIAAGNASFHGCGLRNCIINCTGSGTGEIVIDSGCQPYNAPLDCQVFTTGATSNPVVLFDNQSTKNCTFYGQLKLEPTTLRPLVLASATSTGATWFTGSITAIDKSWTRGTMRIMGDVVSLDTAGAPTIGKIDSGTINCTSTANTCTNTRIDGASLVSVQLIGALYRYHDILLAGAHGASGAGWASLFHRHIVTDGANYGDPAYTIDTSGQLVITNSAFNSHSATATITSANPGVVSWAAHGLHDGNVVQFTTTGALPTNVVASTNYWITIVDGGSFKLSTSLANQQAGTWIDCTAGVQSGTHTGVYTSDIVGYFDMTQFGQQAVSSAPRSNMMAL